MDATSPAWTPPGLGPEGGTFDDDRARHERLAHLLGLGAGVLILAGAFLLAILMTFLGLFGAWPASWLWAPDDPGNVGGLLLAAFLMGLWGLLTGALVLWGASRLGAPQEHALAPGLAMVAGGLLSFLSLGGFVVGGLGAIVAGVLAISAAPPMAFERGPRLRPNRAGPGI